MTRRPILVAALAGASVAGFVAGTAASATLPSGVTGRAVSSLCGVAPAGGQTCPDRAVRATIVVVRRSSMRRVATARTDAAGRFRVALAPGAYELRASAPGSLLRARPVDAQVRPHRFDSVIVRFYSSHPVPVAPAAG